MYIEIWNAEGEEFAQRERIIASFWYLRSYLDNTMTRILFSTLFMLTMSVTAPQDAHKRKLVLQVAEWLTGVT